MGITFDCTKIKIKDIPKQLKVEYDQDDKCIVWYDDLYTLLKEKETLESAIEELREQLGIHPQGL